MAGRWPGAPLDAWERRLESAVTVVPYVSLGLATVLAVASARFIPQPPLEPTLVLSAFAAVWMLWFVTWHPAWAERRRLMACYYLGLLALIAVLVVRNPLYGFYAFTGYLHAAYALRGWRRFMGIGATAVLSALSQIGGVATLGSAIGWLFFAVVALFNVAVASVMAFLALVGAEQSERRRQIIDELALANERLEA